MSVRVRLGAVVLAALSLVVAVAVQPGTAGATPRWAPQSTATIRPGVQVLTGDDQCTANFVFYDARGNVYIGQAAHCASTGSSSQTNGCTTPSRPLGTRVTFVRGANFFSSGTTLGHGTLVYSSWRSMQRLHTKDANRCAYNDFALIRVDVVDRHKVNPTVPYWGGPNTFGGTPLSAGAPIFTVGNSALRFGGGHGASKTGTVIDRIGGGWAYDIKTGNPGIPGDSGSGFLDGRGRAVGVLSTLSVGLGLGTSPVSNTMGDLANEIFWARSYSGIKGLKLATGTTLFRASGGVA